MTSYTAVVDRVVNAHYFELDNSVQIGLDNIQIQCVLTAANLRFAMY